MNIELSSKTQENIEVTSKLLKAGMTMSMFDAVSNAIYKYYYTQNILLSDEGDPLHNFMSDLYVQLAPQNTLDNTTLNENTIYDALLVLQSRYKENLSMGAKSAKRKEIKANMLKEKGSLSDDDLAKIEDLTEEFIQKNRVSALILEDVLENEFYHIGSESA